MQNKTHRAAIYTTLYIAALLLTYTPKTVAQNTKPCTTIAWWNVENLFDTRNDPTTNDDDFTPQGNYHWTHRKLEKKINGIYKTLFMMQMPDIVGFAEVENKYVLRELCNGTPLAKAGYRYVHYDSPDHRGIDVALIYRNDRFTVDTSSYIRVSDSASGFYTRDILSVCGHTPQGDTICLLLNHWPSKRGGDEAEAQRLRIADTLRRNMLRLHRRYPTAAVVAMGDMNSAADEAAVDCGMRFAGKATSAEGITNLTLMLPSKWGSHKYQGHWEYLDHMYYISGGDWQVADMQLVRYKHLLTNEKTLPGVRPLRTNVGPHYEGGLSDHLPLVLTLRHSAQ